MVETTKLLFFLYLHRIFAGLSKKGDKMEMSSAALDSMNTAVQQLTNSAKARVEDAKKDTSGASAAANPVEDGRGSAEGKGQNVDTTA